MPERLRVAVIGVRGIGRHHARWYDLVGCDVVAFAGTNSETCAKGEEAIKQLFDFRGRAYWDVEAMLKAERPGIVDVSSPPQLHKEHALMALDAGAHVMCEKPFVWDETKTPEVLLDDAEEIVRAAEAKGRALGISTQYVAAIPVYQRIHEEVRGPIGDIRTISMTMDSLARNGGKEYETIWADMASHPISMVIAWLRSKKFDPASVVGTIARKENTVHFRYGDAEVDIVHRNLSKGSTPTRRFGVNGFMVDWGGRPDARGIFRAYLRHEGKEWEVEDFMHTTIAKFVAFVREEPDGAILATGQDGVENLRIQMEILQRCRRGSS
jgi:predicted dehydrogenase